MQLVAAVQVDAVAVVLLMLLKDPFGKYGCKQDSRAVTQEVYEDWFISSEEQQAPKSDGA